MEQFQWNLLLLVQFVKIDIVSQEMTILHAAQVNIMSQNDTIFLQNTSFYIMNFIPVGICFRASINHLA